MAKKFYIDKVIQSQYANSTHIKNIVYNFWDKINPESDINLIYDKVVNLDTAEGYGLDVWGRIVGFPRQFISVEEETKYFGFKELEGSYNSRLETFNNAPFYQTVNGRVQLSDEGYRFYILIKAFINISDSSLYFLNQIISRLFKDKKIEIIHTDTMELRLVIQDMIPDVAKNALLSLNWLPAGVNLDIYQVITPTFGFDGSELNPFDQGTFVYDVPHGAI